MKFDPKPTRARLEKFWSLVAQFGLERSALDVFIDEIVSNRAALTRGLQVLRDELQLAGTCERTGANVEACGADLSLPSIVTTVAHTNCGDRIHQGEAMTSYDQVVGARFATLSEIGELKVEKFSPTGGGTDDGATLAHVTVGHQLDEPLRRRVYEGNVQSCVLVGIDLMTHVGRLDEEGGITFGRCRESPWREPRAACGAIVGALQSYNPENGVHRRLRRDLGEENFAFLLRNKVLTVDGRDITAAVAASIIAIQGMRNVARAVVNEVDERGIAHVTASLTVNRVGQDDTMIYLSRATAFGGDLLYQGLGTQAHKYTGRIVDDQGDRRLELIYDGVDGMKTSVRRQKYEIPDRSQAPEAKRAATDTKARAPATKVFESSDDIPVPPMGSTLAIEKPVLPPRKPGRRWGGPPVQ